LPFVSSIKTAEGKGEREIQRDSPAPLLPFEVENPQALMDKDT
jgi:hypothetical protein